jgi:hypothetical protein
MLLLWEGTGKRGRTAIAQRLVRAVPRLESRLSPTMRQAHPAGERLFVGNVGQTFDLTDGRTCDQRRSSSP